MPEHVHLLTFPQSTASRIDELLKAIKRPFSYRIKRLLTETGSPLLRRLTVLQRPGVSVFRFWQEGPGYDRNLISLETALAATTYIHRNPVRRGLVACELDWRWSSARHYTEPAMEADHGLPSVTTLGEIVII
jgi:REP-associated tyrosine transposase